MASKKKYVSFNCRGQAMVVALALGAMGLLSVAAGFSMMANYLRNSAKVKVANQTTQKNLVVLDSLAERFRMGSDGKATWYPNPYPTSSSLSKSALPVIGVIKPAAANTTVLVPVYDPTGKKVIYDADSSGLGAILQIQQVQDSQGNQIANQMAWVAMGDLSLLSGQALGTFFATPDSSLPQNSSVLNLGQVSFLQYQMSPTQPQLVSNLIVSVKSGSVSNVASIAIDPPAEPSSQCQIALAPGQRLPIAIGSNAQFTVSSDSLVSDVQLSPDNWTTLQDLGMPSGQSNSNAKTFMPVGTASIQAPAAAFPGGAMGTGTKWTVMAKVYSLATSSVSQCSIDVPVKIIPPPICALSSNPQQVLPGASTVLTLSCQNEVDSAYVQGPDGLQRPVTLDGNGNGTLTYTRQTNNQNETVKGHAAGPGGSWDGQTVLGIGCPFNDPNYSSLVTNPFIYTSYSSGAQSTVQVSQLISHGPIRQIAASPISYWDKCAGKCNGIAGWWHSITGGTYVYGADGNPTSNVPWTGANYPCPPDQLCMFGYVQGNYVSTAVYTNGAQASGGNTVTNMNSVRYTYGPAEDPKCQPTAVNARLDGCFLEGTKLQVAENLDKPIEQIRIGDEVWNPKTKLSTRVVDVVRGPENKALWEINLESTKVVVTEDHPFKTPKGWKQARNLHPGEILLGDGQNTKVRTVKKLKMRDNQIVWNVKLEGEDYQNHFVLANGVPTGDLGIQQALKKKKGLKDSQELP